MNDVINPGLRMTGRVIGLDEARLRLRVSAGDQPASRRAHSGPIDPPDDEPVMYPLVDAVLMLFHLNASDHFRFAIANLRDAIRRAVASQPMCEAVEIRSSTWAVIQDIGFMQARSACLSRFAAAYGNDGTER